MPAIASGAAVGATYALASCLRIASPLPRGDASAPLAVAPAPFALPEWIERLARWFAERDPSRHFATARTIDDCTLAPGAVPSDRLLTARAIAAVAAIGEPLHVAVFGWPDRASLEIRFHAVGALDVLLDAGEHFDAWCAAAHGDVALVVTNEAGSGALALTVPPAPGRTHLVLLSSIADVETVGEAAEGIG